MLDVVSFTRLANLVKRRFGGLSFNSAGRADRVLLMWKAIASVAPLLRVFGNEKNSARTVKIMQEALDELRRGGVGAEDAARLSDIFSSEEATASLSDRLHDISLVMAEYENSFGESFDVRERSRSICSIRCAGAISSPDTMCMWILFTR